MWDYNLFGLKLGIKKKKNGEKHWERYEEIK